ncbi:hypothetical protein [Pseudoalteromonas sp. McH1-42]|uniref:hypothetical protein n=1 Tax=Pseudoalteromonas sp. McH1-42 TaxID=2917752 RepID=UPI001EF63D7E|nr:hypothetical protein [Pseudoalteromonas sp. McH1-42]MCG7564632.1 hypothetical protein [Pseudoalteromonas sp. McH1-42]
MARLKIGDIVEVKTSKGNVYAQYTHKHKQYGALLRVFNRAYEHRPEDLSNAINESVQFSAFFPLQLAVKQKIVEIVGNCKVDSRYAEFPVFRAGVVDPSTGKVAVWWLWDGQNEEKVGKLSSEQRKLPIRGVWNDTLLIERIESGWTPETDNT